MILYWKCFSQEQPHCWNEIQITFASCKFIIVLKTKKFRRNLFFLFLSSFLSNVLKNIFWGHNSAFASLNFFHVRIQNNCFFVTSNQYFTENITLRNNLRNILTTNVIYRWILNFMAIKIRDKIADISRTARNFWMKF